MRGVPGVYDRRGFRVRTPHDVVAELISRFRDGKILIPYPGEFTLTPAGLGGYDAGNARLITFSGMVGRLMMFGDAPAGLRSKVYRLITRAADQLYRWDKPITDWLAVQLLVEHLGQEGLMRILRRALELPAPTDAVGAAEVPGIFRRNAAPPLVRARVV